MAANAPILTPVRVFLTGLIFISASSVISLYWFSDQLMLQAAENLRFVTDLKHGYVEKVIAERRADARVFATFPLVATLLEAGDGSPAQATAASQLKPLLENFRDAYGYTSVQVFTSSKLRVDANSSDAPEAEVDAALSRAIADGQPHFVDIHKSVKGLNVFGTVQPIIVARAASPGGISGAVYVEVNADSALIPDLTQWPVPSVSGESFLFRKDGNDVVYLSPVRHRPKDAPMIFRTRDALTPQLQSLPAHEVEIIKDYNGVAVLAFARQVTGTDWYLAAKIDQSEVYKPARVFFAANATTSLIGIALLFFLSRAVARIHAAKEARLKAEFTGRYQAAIANTLDAIIVLDPNGAIIEWNAAAEGLLGYSPQELKTKTVADLCNPSSSLNNEEFLSRIQNVVRERSTTQWIRRDGVIVDVDLSITFVPDVESGDRILASARDITEEKVAQRRLEYLNRVLSFLNATNKAIRTLHDIPAILDAACRAALEVGKFRLVWAGIPDAQGLVQNVSAYGDAAEYVRNIVVTTNPSLETSKGPTGVALNTGKTIALNDFRADPRTAAWHETAKKYDLASSVAAPIVVGGSPVAAIMFYSDVVDFFDFDVLELIDRVQQNIALACETARFGELTTAAEKKARTLEQRYETIFESSPTAMQIISKSKGRANRINKAHQELFGYEPMELPTEDTWFEKMYPDPVFRKNIREEWANDLGRAEATNQGATSPHLRLLRKDGAPRIVQGRMTATEDDVIVAWSDLTELEEQSRTLREGEARFRRLIDQTITGIYVVRDRKIQFANSRFEVISGYRAEELFGLDPAFMLSGNSLATFTAARRALEDGSPAADLTVQLQRKDGEMRDITIHAAKSSWDGHPAIIAISQDISEQKRSEEQIAAYLRQLKASMRGTLSAVAKMVDLRDPYTAGHERRVGLIAAAIGKELGLAEEACEWLNWAGLVHDIGKISVPAELLSKPTRLTAIEYEMIKGHAQAGYEILKDVEFPTPVAEIARQHHERMDGTGYPRGLAGEQILIEARILAVADVLESMASHRPYRPGLGIDAALEELETHRGTYYDAPVVDALLRLIREVGWRLPK